MFEQLFDEISIDCSTITTGNIIFPLSGGKMAGRTICLMHSRRSSSSIVADNHSPDIVCCHDIPDGHEPVVGITRNRLYKVNLNLGVQLLHLSVTRAIAGFAMHAGVL